MRSVFFCLSISSIGREKNKTPSFIRWIAPFVSAIKVYARFVLFLLLSFFVSFFSLLFVCVCVCRFLSIVLAVIRLLFIFLPIKFIFFSFLWCAQSWNRTRLTEHTTCTAYGMDHFQFFRRCPGVYVASVLSHRFDFTRKSMLSRLFHLSLSHSRSFFFPYFRWIRALSHFFHGICLQNRFVSNGFVNLVSFFAHTSSRLSQA